MSFAAAESIYNVTPRKSSKAPNSPAGLAPRFFSGIGVICPFPSPEKNGDEMDAA
jgi:hypothetical protein